MVKTASTKALGLEESRHLYEGERKPEWPEFRVRWCRLKLEMEVANWTLPGHGKIFGSLSLELFIWNGRLCPSLKLSQVVGGRVHWWGTRMKGCFGKDTAHPNCTDLLGESTFPSVNGEYLSSLLPTFSGPPHLLLSSASLVSPFFLSWVPAHGPQTLQNHLGRWKRTVEYMMG